MTQTVLMSIQPKWCKLIASGKKTVEIRKTKPHMMLPFKCYIYETKGRTWQNKNEPKMQEGKGRVIGEFVCDKIDGDIVCGKIADTAILCLTAQADSCRFLACLTEKELYEYGNGKPLYGWYISDLKLYDKPKQLSEFNLKRPPQSWCYVEEQK